MPSEPYAYAYEIRIAGGGEWHETIQRRHPKDTLDEAPVEWRDVRPLVEADEAPMMPPLPRYEIRHPDDVDTIHVEAGGAGGGAKGANIAETPDEDPRGGGDDGE